MKTRPAIRARGRVQPYRTLVWTSAPAYVYLGSL